jgi:hypothetical protein
MGVWLWLTGVKDVTKDSLASLYTVSCENSHVRLHGHLFSPIYHTTNSRCFSIATA